ncbi:MAG: beta-ketoacyl synthase N-terminal-like domain-containing protein [Desulfobacteraceae bacterium]
MTYPNIDVAGLGLISALGQNVDETLNAIEGCRSGLRPLTRFQPPHHDPLPVGQIRDLGEPGLLPLTHQMARIAASEAMAGCGKPPDAIILGVTTGGIAVTEELLKMDRLDPEGFRYHAIGSVAADLAEQYQCSGPVLTISTACSSGGAAIALARAMLRCGSFQHILAGGVDSLCRLTYYGFKSLQLIDPEGSRPMDLQRRGMSVAEGAGMLLLKATTETNDAIRVLGAGLSCDAHHPAQPHPEGKGAQAAMEAALDDAGLSADQIDYINLHGTGTIDNDRSEARAIRSLFGEHAPAVSSIKGATGHSLGAAGAIEAVISAKAIERGLLPGNTGYRSPDPELDLVPVTAPAAKSIQTVMSNSFGFGGNNATIILGRSDRPQPAPPPVQQPLYISGWSAVSGAGGTRDTLARLESNGDCRGAAAAAELGRNLPPQMIRRLKRLSLMTVAMAAEARSNAGDPEIASVFFGTGWGSLSETNDFLNGLFESDEKFPSPIDFIGSVHNAPAGQLALAHRATGANITVSGGDYSFEQALLAAQYLAPDEAAFLVAAADEGHAKLSPLFDPSVAATSPICDGGGVLVLNRRPVANAPTIALKHFETGSGDMAMPDRMVETLGDLNGRIGLVLAGIPAAQRTMGREQLDRFISQTGYSGPVLDYRRQIGEFASATAVAAVFAAALAGDPNRSEDFSGAQAPGILVLGLGSSLTAMEVSPHEGTADIGE